MMALCELCGNPADRSAVHRGTYYEHICLACISGNVSTGQATYNRQRDAESSEADTRQPYTNGKPDAKFIHLYPNQAKRMFTPEQIKQAYRE